jgi:hypothetical protein
MSELDMTGPGQCSARSQQDKERYFLETPRTSRPQSLDHVNHLTMHLRLSLPDGYSVHPLPGIHTVSSRLTHVALLAIVYKEQLCKL